jgi:HSP20 family molecular chaperone IbpA
MKRNKGNKKAYIREHASKNSSREIGLPEDIRVIHAEEHNPEDG